MSIFQLPVAVRALYTENDVYKPKLKKDWLRSGNNKKSPTKSGIKKPIQKTRPLKQKKSKFDVDEDTFKYSQRLQSLYFAIYEFIFAVGLFIILDSELFHTGNMFLETFQKRKMLGLPIPKNITFVFINGDEDSVIPETTNEFNIQFIKTDIYTYVKNLEDKTKILLLWNDSMSAYHTEYRNNRTKQRFSSTEQLFDLMCQKQLFDDTFVMWNANFGRHNKNTYYSDESQFNIASRNFLSAGYRTTDLSWHLLDEKINPIERNGCSTVMYKYNDNPSSYYLFHMFKVEKIIIELD